MADRAAVRENVSGGVLTIFMLEIGIHRSVTTSPVVLGGELAVPFTRNPLHAGLNSL
jgi:hypothetical protein